MSRLLVVVEPRPEIEELLDVASDFARSTGSELLLLHPMAESEGRSNREKMREFTGADQSYRPGIEGAESFVRDVGESLLANDIDYSVKGAFGERADQILTVAEDFDCDHIFITGRRRSPTGKAMFGDTPQKVLLSATVPVTVILG